MGKDIGRVIDAAWIASAFAGNESTPHYPVFWEDLRATVAALAQVTRERAEYVQALGLELQRRVQAEKERDEFKAMHENDQGTIGALERQRIVPTIEIQSAENERDMMRHERDGVRAAFDGISEALTRAREDRDEARAEVERLRFEMTSLRPHSPGCNYQRRGDAYPCSCMTDNERLREALREVLPFVNAVHFTAETMRQGLEAAERARAALAGKGGGK